MIADIAERDAEALRGEALKLASEAGAVRGYVRRYSLISQGEVRFGVVRFENARGIRFASTFEHSEAGDLAARRAYDEQVKFL